MSAWVKSLETTEHPSLAAMKDELVTLVAAGKKATDIRDALVIDIRNFREQGERQQFFDQVNAERKNLEGALAKLALSTPGLPAGFQNQFFKPGEADEPEDTVESVKAEIKALEDQLEERKKRLDELEKAADAEAADATLKANAQAELDALNKEIDEKKKKAKELEDKLT
jgi:DNA repair exonuclease SbcCD ATPase subunit